MYNIVLAVFLLVDAVVQSVARLDASLLAHHSITSTHPSRSVTDSWRNSELRGCVRNSEAAYYSIVGCGILLPGNTTAGDSTFQVFVVVLRSIALNWAGLFFQLGRFPPDIPTPVLELKIRNFATPHTNGDEHAEVAN